MPLKIIKNDKFKGEKAVKYFHPGFFWDCYKDNIIFDNDYDLIIERVLSCSFDLKKDLEILEEIYPIKLIKKIAIDNSGQIFGNEQIEKIAIHYKLNPKKFRRYYIETT